MCENLCQYCRLAESCQQSNFERLKAAGRKLLGARELEKKPQAPQYRFIS